MVPRGHDNPRAAPVYFAHRDTWYGVPRCVVNVWIALDDVAEDETFELFPERFGVPVANDSAAFDSAVWRAPERGLRVGWQDASASASVHYPTVTGVQELGPPIRFSCARAGMLVFSGAHLHRTLAHTRTLTRFSVDARLLDVGDRARGAGAPRSDEACRGDMSVDYLAPSDLDA